MCCSCCQLRQVAVSPSPCLYIHTSTHSSPLTQRVEDACHRGGGGALHKMIEQSLTAHVQGIVRQLACESGHATAAQLSAFLVRGPGRYDMRLCRRHAAWPRCTPCTPSLLHCLLHTADHMAAVRPPSPSHPPDLHSYGACIHAQPCC